MMQISLCMIVKDEEEVLRRCLSSIAYLCDEIIIVDTGSTDGTIDIIKQFTNNIYHFKWVDDFSAARNFSFEKATKDFILWLDADDVLSKENQVKLATLKKELKLDIDAVSMLYHIDFDEYGNPSFSFRRNRLINRNRQFQWIGPVHEYLDVHGNISYADIAVEHRKDKKTIDNTVSDRNLQIYQNRLRKGEELSPRDLFYYANELKDHNNYKDAITNYKTFLQTNKGWIEDIIRAYIYMADCYRLLSEPEKEMDALVKTFAHDVPRPETCCRIGDLYLSKGEVNKAIFWYELAIEVGIANDIGFNIIGFHTWYPHMQLCICYWNIGSVDKAKRHNDSAKQYLPNDSTIAYNERFFENME
ncbi:glycosyltransferase family 2 protein [Virgibacillus necropolis]|uniref:tetratricopeptide repeat-containing glycosyltransferase family 2 protein n=1 Tax=Virgibacillus necropolis TaxID=163877 RepID=UPI003850419D